MAELEQTITTVEIAEMMETSHADILKKLEGRKDRKGYLQIISEGQMSVADFFIKSVYIDAQGKERPCYKATKLGCDFLAHKSTGEKGVRFTARYIKRFYEIQDMITQAEESKQDKIDGVAKSEISIAQMEKLQGFIERQQQFMEHQEKFNQMVIEKLESSKCIQVRQVERNKEIFTMSGMKGEIINIVELVKDDRIVKMIYGFVIGCKKNSSKTQ